MKRNQEGLKFMFLPVMAVVLTTLLGLQGLLSFWTIVCVVFVALSPVLHSHIVLFESDRGKEFWEGVITSLTLLAFFWSSMVVYGVHTVAVLAYAVWTIAAMPFLGVCWKCVLERFKGD